MGCVDITQGFIEVDGGIGWHWSVLAEGFVERELQGAD
jgi:hypothetical protein